MSFKFSRHLPTRQQILESRWLQPFREHLHDRRLWRLERHATARGAAIGMFCAFIVPIGQIPLSAVLSIIFRANIPVAALFTFVTNPFTFPAVFWIEYTIGSIILGRGHGKVTETLIAQSDKITPEAAITHPSFTEWLRTTVEWLGNAGLPFFIGTVVMAVVGSIVGYFLVQGYWQMRGRWRKRRLARRNEERAAADQREQ